MTRKSDDRLRRQVYAVAQAIQHRTGKPPETVHVTRLQMMQWEAAGWSTLLPNGTRLEVFDESQVLS